METIKAVCGANGKTISCCGQSCLRHVKEADWRPPLLVAHYQYGFVARINGEGPGASSLRTFLNPASSSQFLISLKLKVSPCSVFASICTANMSECVGSVRLSFTSHSATAMIPPGFSALKVFLSN